MDPQYGVGGQKPIPSQFNLIKEPFQNMSVPSGNQRQIPQSDFTQPPLPPQVVSPSGINTNLGHHMPPMTPFNIQTQQSAIQNTQPLARANLSKENNAQMYTHDTSFPSAGIASLPAQANLNPTHLQNNIRPPPADHTFSQLGSQEREDQNRFSGSNLPRTINQEPHLIPNVSQQNMDNIKNGNRAPTQNVFNQTSQIQKGMPGQNHPLDSAQYYKSMSGPAKPPLSGGNDFNPPPFAGGPLQGSTQAFPPPPMPFPMNQNQSNIPPLLQPNEPAGIARQMQGMALDSSRSYPYAPVKNVNQMPPPPGPPGPVNGQQAPPFGGNMNYPQPVYQQPQQVKRLDPDQMPSPIQVIQYDQETHSGIFCTNQKGLVPPLVTTKFIVQDQGNASPRFMRSTMYNVPISQDIMKQTSVPFSLVISPLARTLEQEYPPPIVNFGDLGPVRCVRCKAYMCPFMQFIDSGRRFQCLFCKATTDVPQEYFQHLDHAGNRLDRFERPEMMLGTYEIVATPDYCRNNKLPNPPAIIFVIDVSYNNVRSGLVHLMCARMKEILKHLPIDQGQTESNMKVGFITYNNSVHFYNIKGNLAMPQMLIVGDNQEMFMPLLDGFLCTPEESSVVIDSLLEQIPLMFGDTKETETILLPAISAGLEALKASDCAGKLLVFHSSLPTAEAPGKLKNRDDRKLLGSDKEKTVLVPQTQAYNNLGQECVNAGCSVDLFIFNNAYIDIATISQVCRLTGGEVYKYTYFRADVDGERLFQDIITNISRNIGFDAVMRIRTSTGVRPTDFYGHFYMSNTTDIELAAVDCDKAIAVEIKHDDKLNEADGVYIQAALLYTSCSGQRRLRIINLSLKTCSQMADLYRSCDCDTIINYLAKQSIRKLYEHSPKAVKDYLVSRAAQILATYRKNCASPTSAGQLILPECMKLLPLYISCLLKSDGLSGGPEMSIDDKVFVMEEMMIMDVSSSLHHLYPRLIPLNDIIGDTSSNEVVVPEAVTRCTFEKINDQGLYILENGIHMFFWIGLSVRPDLIQNLFGVQSAMQIDVERLFTLPELENPISKAVRALIDEIRTQRHKCMRLSIVRQGDKLEAVFKHFLVEDRGNDGSPSYVDFLIHMHKEIRTLLS